MGPKVTWIKLKCHCPVVDSQYIINGHDDEEINIMYVSIVTILSLYQKMECTKHVNSMLLNTEFEPSTSGKCA